MLLARMGVDVAHQGKGLGDFLIRYALHSGYCFWDTLGCHAIIVDAKNERLKGLYEKYGFIAFSGNPLRLYLPIGSLVKLN
jgi:ribosomal protein S18 acetylase RimI-like enzyme